MVLLPHMLAGAIVGAKIHSYAVIVPVSLALHFFLDALPHWEYKVRGLDKPYGAKFLVFLAKVVLDLTLGAAVIWWFLGGSPYLGYIFFSVFISLLPDGLLLMQGLAKGRSKFLNRLRLFHKGVHLRDNKKLAVSGLIVETAVVAAAIYVIVFIFPA